MGFAQRLWLKKKLLDVRNFQTLAVRALPMSFVWLVRKVYESNYICLWALNAGGSLQQSPEGKTLWLREMSPKRPGWSDDGPSWQHQNTANSRVSWEDEEDALLIIFVIISSSVFLWKELARVKKKTHALFATPSALELSLTATGCHQFPRRLAFPRNARKTGMRTVQRHWRNQTPESRLIYPRSHLHFLVATRRWSTLHRLIFTDVNNTTLLSQLQKNLIHWSPYSRFLQVLDFLEKKQRKDQHWQTKLWSFTRRSKRRQDLHLMFSSQETEVNWGMLLEDHSESRLVRKEKKKKYMQPLWNRTKPDWVCSQPFGFTISYMFASFWQYLQCKWYKLTVSLDFLQPTVCFCLAGG